MTTAEVIVRLRNKSAFMIAEEKFKATQDPLVYGEILYFER